MDYRRHYDRLIDRARGRVLDCYVEWHHIVPRCMGGGDEDSNLVALTPEEHFVAHQILLKLHPDNRKIAHAAYAMTIKTLPDGTRNKAYGWLARASTEAKRGVARSPETVEKMRESLRTSPKAIAAREAFKRLQATPEFRAVISEALRNSEAAKAASALRRGIPRSDELKFKVSESHKSSEAAKVARAALHAAKVGKPRSDETKQKLRVANTGKKVSAETRARQSAALSGRKLSDGHKDQLRVRMTGKRYRLGMTNSESQNAKIAAAHLGLTHTPEAIAHMRALQAALTPEQRSARAHKAWETKRAKAALAA